MEVRTTQEVAKETANVDKIAVWWDIENCHVPKEVDPDDIALNIGSALKKANLCGPISISAYGDTQLLKREVQQKLTSTGVNLHHIPSGQKDASDKAILVGMLLWALDNPPPAHILLISGDRDFSNALHRLRMKTYDILLARPAGVNVSTSLIAAASSMWIWSSLAKGEDVNDAKTVTSKEHPIMAITSASPNNSYPKFNVRPPPGYLAQSIGSNGQIGSKNIAPQQYEFPGSLEFRETTSQQQASPSSKTWAPAAISSQQQASPSSKTWAPAAISSQQFRETTSQQQASPSSKTWAPAAISSQQQASPRSKTWAPAAISNIRKFPTSVVYSYQLPHEHGSVPMDIHQVSLNTILKAIETLQLEMMLPTEENIYSCIRSGVKPLEFLLFRKTLSKAIEMRELMVKTAGSDQVQCFLPWNMELWVCVDPEMSYDYSVDIWNDFRAFLCSHEGKIALSNSKTRYDAALTLRNSGPPRMRSLALAQLVNIIQISITVKEWLKPHPTSWFPVHVFVVDSENIYFKQPGSVRESVSLKRRQNSDVPSIILKSLRSWLVHLLSTQTFEYGYALSQLQQDFELATKVKLEPSMLGFSGLLELVQSFSDVVWIKQRNGVCFLFPVSKSPTTLLKEALAIPLFSSSNNVNTLHENKSHLKQLKESDSRGFRTMQLNPKIVLEKLRAWLSMLVNSSSDGYDLRSLWESFRTAHNFNFDLEVLGFSNLQDMFKQFPDLVRLEYDAGNWILFFIRHTLDNTLDNHGQTLKLVCSEGCIQTAASSSNSRYGKSSSKLVADCEIILKEVLPVHPKGYPQSKLGEDFRKRFGYELDYRCYGFLQLSDLISCITERVIISTGKDGEQLIHLAEEHLMLTLKSINLNQRSAKDVLDMHTQEVIGKTSTISSAEPFQEIKVTGTLEGEGGMANEYAMANSPPKTISMHAFLTDVFGTPT